MATGLVLLAASTVAFCQARGPFEAGAAASLQAPAPAATPAGGGPPEAAVSEITALGDRSAASGLPATVRPDPGGRGRRRQPPRVDCRATNSAWTTSCRCLWPDCSASSTSSSAAVRPSSYRGCRMEERGTAAAAATSMSS